MLSYREDSYVSPNSRSGTNIGYAGRDKSPKAQLSNLYDQLRETNSKLKEGSSQHNSMLFSNIGEESIERTKNGNVSRLKEDEIKKMRNEKLEKIRSEKSQYIDKSPRARDTSPKFHQERSLVNKTNFGRETFQQQGYEEHEGEENNPPNIDIARDYLLYSASKTHKTDDQKSFSNMNLSAFEDQDEYIQLKFYNRQKERAHAGKLLQEKIQEDILKNANSKKMGQNSYKIMIRKLEASLSQVLLDVDREGRKLITFEQLGRIFALLEIFRIIQYDENFNLENEEQFFSGSAQDQQRRYSEMVIHEEVWKLLADNDETEYVDTEFVYIFFRILLDPANLPPSETVKILQEYIDKYRRDAIIKEHGETELQDITIENWQLMELVKNFRKLTENRLYYNKTGFIKQEKAEEVAQKKDEWTFKPKVSELSKAIDQYSTKRFLEKNPIETRSRSPSPYQPRTKENLDNLLFEMKGMQNAVQGKTSYNQRVHTHGNDSLISKGDLDSSVNRNLNNQRVELLLKKHELTQKRKEEQIKKKQMEDLKDCTFQPLIKNYTSHTVRDPNETANRLYNYTRTKKKLEEERIMEQIQKETKEMEECTFKPDINANSVTGPKEMPKGFEKNIIRMRYAIDENKKKKEALEKKPVGENYEKIRKANIKPFSFVDNPRAKRNPPFVHIEINVAPGRTGRIGIHEDDDPRILAKNFAVAFQISEDMERNLEEIITKQLQDHFEQNQYGYEN